MKIIRFQAIWCSGCLVMQKVWREIEKQHSDIEMIMYDYDQNPDMVQMYQVGNLLPVTIFMKDGQEMGRLNGEKTVSEIEQAIGEWL